MTKSSTSLTLLADYTRAIDEDISQYTKNVRRQTAEQYGQDIVDVEAGVFLDILSRGGKRIRGALVMAGYEMCGGKDMGMIVQVARAIEMIHAYLLIMDDIQDRSTLRRGKPSAHYMIADYHRKHNLKGDPEHAGLSLALMAALSGMHAAQMIIANVDVESDLRIKALSILNRTLIVTAHGQSQDILNEMVSRPKTEDIDKVLEWKTALYSIINPLHVGMVLAGADCRATDAITPYGHHVGKAFQIVDDILGIFGSQQETGKVPGDDIREGKGTILVAYALDKADLADRKFLQKHLGNQNLTSKELDACRQIFQNTGAVDKAQLEAEKHLKAALESLEGTEELWDPKGTEFLRQLALKLQNRKG